jgi:hypothetical protein
MSSASSNKKRSNSSFSSNPNTTATLTRQALSAKPNTNNYLLDKEEEYKRLNEELEKKTANLVYEAEQVLKANEKLLNEADYLDKISDVNFLQNDRKTTLEQHSTKEDDDQEEDKEEDEVFKFQMNKKKLGLIEKNEIDEDYYNDNANSALVPRQANEMSNEAQIRFLKAKLKVVQEECERMTGELSKRDEENLKLAQRCKELDEDRGKQLRISNAHQTQVDKLKKLNDELQVKI